MKVKRKFHKVAAILMAVGMLFQLGGVSNAVDDEVFVEIVLECDVDCEKAQLIIDTLNGNTHNNGEFTPIAPANILCLFGHSWAQTTARTIEHRIWSTTPRCRETIHRVDYCTRSGCNRMDLTLISQRAIHCC